MEARRQKILEAALGVFLEEGFDGTTLAAIRRKSGASTGSIYHFFSGKHDIAAVLLHDAISGWSAASKFVGARDDAEGAIKASVSGLLLWGLRSQRQFRFMDDLVSRKSDSPEFMAIGKTLAAGRAAAAERYREWQEAGWVRPLPWRVAYALMTGPAYTYLRNAHGVIRANPGDIDLIATAAWDAVRQSLDEVTPK